MCEVLKFNALSCPKEIIPYSRNVQRVLQSPHSRERGGNEDSEPGTLMVTQPGAAEVSLTLRYRLLGQG